MNRPSAWPREKTPRPSYGRLAASGPPAVAARRERQSLFGFEKHLTHTHILYFLFVLFNVFQ